MQESITNKQVLERIFKAMTTFHDGKIAIGNAHDRRLGILLDNALIVLKRRYLAKDTEGNITEDPNGMWRRVAHNLSQAELNYCEANKLSPVNQTVAIEGLFYNAMSRLELIPNSPTLMNAGRELQQLSACFVLPIEDSIDDIFDKVKQTALIHKSGGGTGFDFSRLRPEGSIVGTTGGVASGPVSFIRAFDTATDVVKQGGTRRGANMGILRVDHPDILKFIQSKRGGKALENFNISVAATDYFMEAVKDKGEYCLIDPHTGEATDQVDAREVFDQIVALAHETGDPGLVFIDRVNEGNPNPQLGAIESTNPCGEQPLLPYESCNLASVNLGRMVSYTGSRPAINWLRILDTVNTGVRMLDNVIDMNQYPIPAIAEMSNTTRRIGLGVMGWADMLVQLGIAYDSSAALKLMKDVMSYIRKATHDASHKLAGERGVFPAWEDSVYGPDNGNYEMRNSAPTTIAPTGTISIIAGASSGIEPIFAIAYQREVMDGTLMVEGNQYFEAIAQSEGFYTPELMQEIFERGSVQGMEAVPEWVQHLFHTAQEIDPGWHVDMQAAAQEHTDNAVSKTINLPATATKADILQVYMMAYELKCKGITIYRDGSKAQQVLSTGFTPRTQPSTVEPAVFARPRQRPARVAGVTERVRTGHGNMYITINTDDSDGQPFEVFANQGKAGGCESANIEAISRLTTLILRAGIDPEILIEQLSGITCCPAWDEGTLVKSAPDALALTLSKHLGLAVTKPEGTTRCPDCEMPVVFQEGCWLCLSCAWSKCG